MIEMLKTAAKLTPKQQRYMTDEMAQLELDKQVAIKELNKLRAAHSAALPGSPEQAHLAQQLGKTQNGLQQLHDRHSFLHREHTLEPHIERAARRGETVRLHAAGQKPVGRLESILFGSTGRGGRMAGVAEPQLADHKRIQELLKPVAGAPAAAGPGFWASLGPKAKMLGGAAALAGLGYGAYQLLKPTPPPAPDNRSLYGY